MPTWENFVDLRRLLMVIEDPTLLHEELDRISKNDAFWQPVTWTEQEKVKYPFTVVPLKDPMSHEEEKPALTQGNL